MTANGTCENQMANPAPTAEESAAAAATPDSPIESPNPTQPPPPLTGQDLETLVAQAAKADEHWERLLRLTAELDNFKKRAARERQEAIKFANESLLLKLIPVLDNFEMAMTAANGSATSSVDSIRTGVTMILSQLRQVLGEAGLEEINAADQLFNPAWHEAVAQQDSATAPEGQVLQQIRKGYKLRERLLRAAAVVVARKPAETSPAPEADLPTA